MSRKKYRNVLEYVKDQYGKKNSQLFKYQHAQEVHIHDQFLAKTFLRLLPKRVTPNQLSIFRIIMTPVVVTVILFGNYKLGVFLFLFTAFTDALDGALARTQNKVTQAGMLLDPLADKLLIASMVLVLVVQHLNWVLALAVVGLEIAFILSALMARFGKRGVRQANLWGKIKMIFQVLSVFMMLLALLLDFPVLLTFAAWGFGLAIGFAVLSLFKQGI